MKQGTLEKIQNLAVSLQLVTVEDMRKHSLPQLVTMIANKLNELMNEVHRFETDVIEMVETQNENIQYLLGEGLHLEVATVFERWVEDGTFDTLINQTALKKVNDRIDETNAQLFEVVLKNENIFSLKNFGAKCDGTTDDTSYLLQALKLLKSGQILIINNSYFEKSMTIDDIHGISILFENTKIMDDITFTNSSNINIHGRNCCGYGIKKTRINAIGGNVITVDSPDIFKIDDNVMAHEQSTGFGKFWGGVTAINGNDIEVSTNTIGGALSNLQVGDYLYCCRNTTIKFSNCDNVSVLGDFKLSIGFFICNHVEVDCKLTEGSLSAQFSYNVNVKSIDVEMGNFYGIFMQSSNKIRIAHANIRRSLLTNFCIKSCWNVSVGNFISKKACLISYQVIKNTYATPSIPNAVNPNCQPDLECRYIHFDNFTTIECGQGMRINSYVHNHVVENFISYNCSGRQIQCDGTPIDTIRFGTVRIEKHTNSDEAKQYTGSIPIYIRNTNVATFNSIEIYNSKAKDVLDVADSSSIKIGNLYINHAEGRICFTNVSKITVDNIFVKNLAGYSVLQLANSISDFEVKKCYIDDSCQTTSRYVNIIGNISNLTLNKVRSSTTTSSVKGIWIEETGNGSNIVITNSDLNGSTDSIKVTGSIKGVYIDNNKSIGYNAIHVDVNCECVFIRGNLTNRGNGQSGIVSNSTNQVVEHNIIY